MVPDPRPLDTVAPAPTIDLTCTAYTSDFDGADAGKAYRRTAPSGASVLGSERDGQRDDSDVRR